MEDRPDWGPAEQEPAYVAAGGCAKVTRHSRASRGWQAGHTPWEANPAPLAVRVKAWDTTHQRRSASGRTAPRRRAYGSHHTHTTTRGGRQGRHGSQASHARHGQPTGCTPYDLRGATATSVPRGGATTVAAEPGAAGRIADIRPDPLVAATALKPYSTASL